MRARDMHPLCCITADCPGFSFGGGRSPPETSDSPPETASRALTRADRAQTSAVAGILYKWTNFGKGWRPRWFVLKDGVLTYCKIQRMELAAGPAEACGGGTTLIGGSGVWSRAGDGQKTVRIVHLKISSFRESKSDERRFHIITPSKTLQLRTNSVKDRAAWIEALVSSRRESRLSGTDVLFSTERLKSRMRAEGVGEVAIRECEGIVRAELEECFVRMRVRCDDYAGFLGTFPRRLEVWFDVAGLVYWDESLLLDCDSVLVLVIVQGLSLQFRESHMEFNSEGEITTRIGSDSLRLMTNEYSSSGHGKFSEYSNTESSDDIDQKQEKEESFSEEDEPCFFDTRQSFSEQPTTNKPSQTYKNNNNNNINHCTKRRVRLPDPIEKEKGVSLWSMIKDNVGKDLTRVCLPVYFNEPLSSLQKCFEDLEYSYLLDRAYEFGKKGNGLMRILNVAAFAVSGYASSEGRNCKPFNPLLGETFEADFPEKGLRFFSEKVSHHPMVMACHCEGKGWKFWGDSNLKSKFWGQSIQLDPVGVLTLQFDDGETFQWSKVTTTIYNLIIGKVFCNHHGTMNIVGNRQYSCTLKFKVHSFLDRNPREVEGFVKEESSGRKAAALSGKWDDSMYCSINDDALISVPAQQNNTTLLWKKNSPAANPTRYNLSSFAITLNELTQDLKEKLPPTDSRLRPDQRYLENGEYEKANAEKLRLEKRQRMSSKLQESGWEPRWFHKNNEKETFHYLGGYWEAREKHNWDNCPDIFGEILEDSKKS